jgi:hypothetical protein
MRSSRGRSRRLQCRLLLLCMLCSCQGCWHAKSLLPRQLLRLLGLRQECCCSWHLLLVMAL